MADTIDMAGKRLNLALTRGDATPLKSTFLINGSAVTPTAARLVYKTGTPENPGSVVTGAGSVSINANELTWGCTTPTETRLFTAGSDYCYSLEVDLPNGNTQTLFKGSVFVEPEIA
jgi:hypothetical protein